MSNELKVIDRFEQSNSYDKCELCFYFIDEEKADDVFPCSHCIHNTNHVQEASE